MSSIQRTDREGCLIRCATADLKPHPAFLKLGIGANASRLSALARQGGLGVQEPILVTQDLHILAGNEVWELAKLEHRRSVTCLQVTVTEESSLLKLIQSHQRLAGLNDFTRILLALELEHGYKERARANQSRGGKLKLPANLTEGPPIDVRKEIAAAAQVSVGNVTKAKKLIASAHPEVLEALKRGDVSMHRASQWLDLSLWSQQRAYREYMSDRGMNTAVRLLMANSAPANVPSGPAWTEHASFFPHSGATVA